MIGMPRNESRVPIARAHSDKREGWGKLSTAQNFTRPTRAAQARKPAANRDPCPEFGQRRTRDDALGLVVPRARALRPHGTRYGPTLYTTFIPSSYAIGALSREAFWVLSSTT